MWPIPQVSTSCQQFDTQGYSDYLQVGPALASRRTLDAPIVVFDAGEYALISEIRSKLAEIEKANGPLQSSIATACGAVEELEELLVRRAVSKFQLPRAADAIRKRRHIVSDAAPLTSGQYSAVSAGFGSPRIVLRGLAQLQSDALREDRIKSTVIRSLSLAHPITPALSRSLIS